MYIFFSLSLVSCQPQFAEKMKFRFYAVFAFYLAKAKRDGECIRKRAEATKWIDSSSNNNTTTTECHDQKRKWERERKRDKMCKICAPQNMVDDYKMELNERFVRSFVHSFIDTVAIIFNYFFPHYPPIWFRVCFFFFFFLLFSAYAPKKTKKNVDNFFLLSLSLYDTVCRSFSQCELKWQQLVVFRKLLFGVETYRILFVILKCWMCESHNFFYQ